MSSVGSRESDGWEMKVLGPNGFERSRTCGRELSVQGQKMDAALHVPTEILELPAIAQKHSLTNYDAAYQMLPSDWSGSW
jgi:hypothetical protein